MSAFTGRRCSDPSRRAAAVLLGSAAGYAVALGALRVPFDVTPLSVGVVAGVAGIISQRARLVSIGVALAGWGAAVVLVREGPLPANREAATFLVGAATGMAIASLWAARTRISTLGASVALAAGCVAFYFVSDLDPLGRWPTWSAIVMHLGDRRTAPTWDSGPVMFRDGAVHGAARAEGGRDRSGSHPRDRRDGAGIVA